RYALRAPDGECAACQVWAAAELATALHALESHRSALTGLGTGRRLGGLRRRQKEPQPMYSTCPNRRRRIAVAAVAAALPLLGLLVAANASAMRGPRRPEIRRELRASSQIPHCSAGHHTLSYHGGDLVQHAKAFVLFWGPEWQTDPEHQ